MSDRFRASQGHLGCVLTVAIVVMFLIPATAAHAQQAAAGGLRAARAPPCPRAWTSRTFTAHRKPSDTRIGGPGSSVTLRWAPAKRRQRRRT